MSHRTSKLNSCFVTRDYGAQPGTLTVNILSYAMKGRDSTKRITWIKTSEGNIHWTRIKDVAMPGEYCGA